MGEFKNIAGHFAVLFSFFSSVILAVDGPTPEECWASYLKMNGPPELILPESNKEPSVHNLKVDGYTKRLLELMANDRLLYDPEDFGIPKHLRLDRLLTDLPDEERIDFNVFRETTVEESFFESAGLFGDMGTFRHANGITSLSTDPARAEAEWNIALDHFKDQHDLLVSLGSKLGSSERLIDSAEQIAELKRIPVRKDQITLAGNEGTYYSLIYSKPKQLSFTAREPAIFAYAPDVLRDIENSVGGFASGQYRGKPVTFILVSHEYARTHEIDVTEKHELRHLRWNRLSLKGTPSIFSGRATSYASFLPTFQTGSNLKDSSYNRAQSDEEGINYGRGLRDYLPEMIEAKRRGNTEQMMVTVGKIHEDARFGLETTLRTQAIAAVLEEYSRFQHEINFEEGRPPEDPTILIDERLQVRFPKKSRSWKQYAELKVLKKVGKNRFKIWFEYQLPLKDNDRILDLKAKDVLSATGKLFHALGALTHRFEMKKKAFRPLERPLQHIQSLAKAYIDQPTIQNYEALEIALRETKFPRVKTLVEN